MDIKDIIEKYATDGVGLTQCKLENGIYLYSMAYCAFRYYLKNRVEGFPVPSAKKILRAYVSFIDESDLFPSILFEKKDLEILEVMIQEKIDERF